MKIIGIHIDGFGKLHNFTIAPGEDISLFFGCNEAGKTTLHLFIRSMLYGASTKKKGGVRSVYDRMRPWQQPEIYRGRITVEFEKQTYLIERDFNKAPDDLTIYAQAQGQQPVPVEDPAALMAQMLGNLSETAYVNTISSGQLGTATQKDMAAELKRYAANISGTMNPGLDADKAILVLKKEKNRLAGEIDESAARKYTAVLSEIKRIEEEIGLPENENKISAYSETVEKLRGDSRLVTDKIGLKSAEIDQYQSDLQNKGFASEAQIDEAAERIQKQYAQYGVTKKKAGSKLAVLVIVLLTIVAVAAAVYGWFYTTGKTSILIMSAAEVCFILGVILIVRLSKLKKRADHEGTELAEAMKPYIGECQPDEASLQLFSDHVLSARRIIAEIGDAQSAQEELHTEQDRLHAEETKWMSDLDQQHQTRTRVEGKLNRLNELRKQAAVLQRKIKANNILRENMESVELAEETIAELAADVKNAAGTYINKEAARMVTALTNGAYDSISAGSNYDIQLNSANGMISVHDMSAGTADQVYLAVRLAAIRFIVGEEDPLPLILDDSFNLFDDERLAASLKFLSENYKGQIMIFTCQKREEQVMNTLGIPYSRLEMV